MRIRNTEQRLRNETLIAESMPRARNSRRSATCCPRGTCPYGGTAIIQSIVRVGQQHSVHFGSMKHSIESVPLGRRHRGGIVKLGSSRDSRAANPFEGCHRLKKPYRPPTVIEIPSPVATLVPRCGQHSLYPYPVPSLTGCILSGSF